MRHALAPALALVTVGAAFAIAPAAHASDPAPTQVSVSAPSFRPAPDGVEDTVTITATVDPSVPTVIISVEPGAASWTLTPDPTTHQASVVWDGTHNNGPAGMMGPGTVTISANAMGYTGSGLLVGTAVTRVTLLVDTIPATRDVELPAKPVLVKALNGRCGKTQTPSAHHWRGSIGFNADAKCDNPRKTYAEGVFAIRPYDTLDGHKVNTFTTVQISVYGGAAPKAYRRSSALLVPRNRWGRFLQPTKLSPRLGWHRSPAVPTSEAMYSDHSFAWDVVSLKHSHYDVQGFKVTIDYTYLY